MAGSEETQETPVDVREGRRKQDLHGLVGKTLAGKYEVDGVLGVGGMGAVYRARQTTVDRLVAIKVLNPELLSDEALVKRFELEARAASRLDHPNTIKIYDFGRDGSLLFLVMELLQGLSLEEIIRKHGPLPVDRAVHIACQICGSLGEAHQKGVVHRDIKPDNIFLQAIDSKRDFVKVLDFGVAKLKDKGAQDITLTQAGIIFGTPKYMSPEQAKAKPLDGRSDLYSLGVVLWEMLAGRVPFLASDPVSILIQHVHDPPPPFREVCPQLNHSEELEALVGRTLAKDREQRFATAEDLREALEGYLAQFGGGNARSGALSGNLPVSSGGFARAASGGTNPPVTAAGHSLGPNTGDVPGSLPSRSGSGPSRYSDEMDALGVGPSPGGQSGWRAGLDRSASTQAVAVEPTRRTSPLVYVVLALTALLAGGVLMLVLRSDPDGGPEGGAAPDTVGGVDTLVAAVELDPADVTAAPDTVGGAETLIAAVELDPADVTSEDPPMVEGTGAALPLEGSGPEQVAAAESRVRVRLVLSRPTEGVTFDFDGVVVEETGTEGEYWVDPAVGTLRVRASASGYRSSTIEASLTDVSADGVVVTEVRLRREQTEPAGDPCVDPRTGLRDPYCTR